LNATEDRSTVDLSADFSDVKIAHKFGEVTRNSGVQCRGV